MRKNYILLLLTIFVFTVSHAQSISGIISDETTNEKLIGVNIISTDGKGIATDIFGKYTLKLEAGTHQITFRYIGYKDVIKDIVLKNGEQKTINIKLKTASEQLSTVVISAGKFEQKLEEITVSMEVLKPSLIENKNTTDIQTAIDQVPGVNITDGQANIRGGSGWSYGAGTRVLVMVDDMPLISGDAGQVQWKLIATENIHQIEVIKGASSALYGSSALNGVINIRTAFPTQKDIDKDTNKTGYLKVNMHSGVYDFAERESLNWNGDKRRAFKGYEFLFSNKENGWDLSIGGNIFKDDGYRMGEITDRKRFNINLKYKDKKIEGLSYGAKGNFLFQSSGSAIIWHSLENAYIPKDSSIQTTNGDTYNIDPFITYHKGNNRHSLRTRYLKVINDNSTKGVDDGQDNESETYYTDYQWQKNLEKIGLRITTGITNELVTARSDLFNGNNQRKNHSFYAQLDQKWRRFNLSVGARYEQFKLTSEEYYMINGEKKNSFQASKPVFRAGLNYKVAEETYLRTSWGQGFRFPSMAELFISTDFSGFRIYPNPELKPESGWSTEVGVKQGVKIGKWMGYLDVAAFLMQYDDMMEFSFGAWHEVGEEIAFGFKSINAGKTQISGVECSISGFGKFTNDFGINVIAGYTFMNPVSLMPHDTIFLAQGVTPITYNNSSSDPSVLKYRYKNIAKLDLEFTYKKLTVGSSFRYNDFMKNVDKIFTEDLIGGENGMIPGINAAREKFEGGDFIIDSRVSYQLNDNLRFAFIVNNMLNREYMSRPADMQPPRTLALQMSLKI
ncbi:MAG: TonB-dependent receptor [Flavobacteriales bacterium]|nr:TonB-dependent receptor [Flavobacteriales bacterium]